MKDHRDLPRASARSPWLYRTPLLIAALVICALCGVNLFRLMSAAAPRNPWEAIEIVEAYRSLNRMPVYEISPRGHATHMYGALVPWAQGEVFRWFGTNNISGRALSLIAALLTVSVLAVSLRDRRSPLFLLIGWAAILGVNHRSGHYFAENRPDMPALLFATLAMVFFYSGDQKRRSLYYGLGSASLVIGFFVKQTVYVFAAVPLVALLLSCRRPRRCEVFFALLPLTISIGTIVALKYLNPAVYHYMVEVPGGYSINGPRAVKYLWEMLLDSPLFMFLLGEWLVFDDKPFSQDPRIRWLLAVLAVTIPFAAISHAKVGGWANSMLPALLPMMTFCALRLPVLMERLERRIPAPATRLVCATFLAILLLMTTFPHLTVANGPLVPVSPWNQHYWDVVSIVRTLPGKVVCPEDPSIPLHAKQYAGQNIFSEKDARPSHGKWPTATPEPVLEELRTAEFVVDITNYWGENVDEKLLNDMGFERAPEFSLDPACYVIWRRNAFGRPTSGHRTALVDTNEWYVYPSSHR